MRRDGLSSTAVALVVLAVIVVAAGGVYLATLPPSNPTSSSTSQSQTTTGSFATSTGNVSAILGQIDLFIQTFNDRNVQPLANFYANNAVLSLTGNTQGLGGTYSGQTQIRILYSASIGHASTLHATASNIKMVTVAPNLANVTMTVDLAGVSPALGNITANIDVAQQWVNQGGTWSIKSDLWNYITFTATNPQTATVFPQWGLQVAGENPNLASEHAFEWRYAPVLAVAVYATLAAVAIAALFLHRRSAREST